MLESFFLVVLFYFIYSTIIFYSLSSPSLYRWNPLSNQSWRARTFVWQRNREQNPFPLHNYPFLVYDDFYSTCTPFTIFLKVLIHVSNENFDQHFNHSGNWIRICYMMCKTSNGFLEPLSSVRLLVEAIINEYDTKVVFLLYFWPFI